MDIINIYITLRVKEGSNLCIHKMLFVFDANTRTRID